MQLICPAIPLGTLGDTRTQLPGLVPWMGKAGKLNINIDYVRLVNNDKVALRAVKDVEGGSHTGAMTGAMSLVFFPAAPLFLFMKGKEIAIPKGTELTAYVNGDIKLGRSQFEK